MAWIKPTQSADLTVFHPGLENGPITRPIMSHETKYRMIRMGESGLKRVD